MTLIDLYPLEFFKISKKYRTQFYDRWNPSNCSNFSIINLINIESPLVEVGLDWRNFKELEVVLNKKLEEKSLNKIPWIFNYNVSFIAWLPKYNKLVEENLHVLRWEVEKRIKWF